MWDTYTNNDTTLYLQYNSYSTYNVRYTFNDATFYLQYCSYSTY